MANDQTPKPVKHPAERAAERAKPEREDQPAQSDSASTAAPSPQRLTPGRPPLFGQ